MPNPQNPELRRSEETLRPRPERGPDPQDVGGDSGAQPVPPENQSGHHPDQDQDKPPADAFAEALGIKSDRELEAEGDASGDAGGEGAPAAKKQAATKKQAAKKASAAPAAAKKATAKAPAKKAAAPQPAAPRAAAPSSASAPGAAKDAANDAAQEAKEAKDAAKDAANDAAKGAKDAAKEAAEKASAAPAAARAAVKKATNAATARTSIGGSGPSDRSGSERAEADEPVSMGMAGTTSKAVSGGVAQDQTENPLEAAAKHHHALPDDKLPHDRGMVTPTGTPVTTRLLTLPMRYCGAALRTSGSAIAAYGRFVRRAGERLTGRS